MEILLFVVLIIITFYVFVQSIRLFYNRYLRTYKQEIRAYLNNKDVNFIETYYPRKKDKKRSPFEDQEIHFQLVYTRGGFRWTKYEYLIVIGEKNNRFQEFWLEIKTTFLRAPKLVFKSGSIINYKKEIESEVIDEYCPSCGCLIFNFEETLCTNCGHNLKSKVI